MQATTSSKRYPYIGFDGRHTALVLGPSKYIVAGPEYPQQLDMTAASAAAFRPLEDYPVLRWIELYTAKNSGIMASQSVKKVLAAMSADPSLEYALDHFSKESIMATKKAAEATDAKAKNAAKAPATEKAPAKAKAEKAAPAAKKTAAKADAAPAKQPTKAAKAAAAEGEGRKGRPSPHALDAKIGKGKEDFKAHVREGSHRYNRYDFLVKNAGKTVGDVLGHEFEPGYPLVSKHISAALEEGYITLSK